MSGLRKDVQAIARGLLKKAHKKGQELVDGDGRPIRSVNHFLKGAQSDSLSSYSAEMKIDMTALTRGAAKIAFGFGHYLLGVKWSLSASAEPLRTVARGQGSSFDAERSVKGAKPEIRSFFIRGEPDDARRMWSA